MSAYKPFEKDFISRTCQIIDEYLQDTTKNYEVTLMTNCLLGLIIIPYERLFSRNPRKYKFLSIPMQELSTNEIPKYRENLPFSTFNYQVKDADQVTFQNISRNDMTINQFFLEMRNSVAHGSVSHEDNNGEIVKIEFKSETPEQFREKSGHTFFEISFEINEFIGFIKELVHLLNKHFI